MLFQCNSTVLVHANSRLLSNANGMENKGIRRANLAALIEEHGGIAALAELVDVDPTYLGNIKREVETPSGLPRGMGDKVARRIEKKLGKPAGWMDLPRGAAASEEAELLEHFRRAPAGMRKIILSTAKSAASAGQESEDAPVSEKTHTTQERRSKFRKSG